MLIHFICYWTLIIHLKVACVVGSQSDKLEITI